jgi:hypothetical protein
MKEHYLFEALREDPYVYIDDEKNLANIDDTITYIANNQLGKRKYSIIESRDENGNLEKRLKEIDFTPLKKLTPSKKFTPLKDSNKEFSNIIFHFFPDDGSRGGKKKHKQTQYKRTRKQRSKSKSKNMKSKKYRRTKK